MASESMPPGIIASHILRTNTGRARPVIEVFGGTGEFVCSQKRYNYSGIDSGALSFSLVLSFFLKKKERTTDYLY
ncbi:MAG: hypothetical protein ACHQQQ_00045 [Bacteroidota bacterium]